MPEVSKACLEEAGIAASEATTAAQIPGICYRPITGEVLPFSGVWSPKNDNPALRRFISMAKIMARRQGVEL